MKRIVVVFSLILQIGALVALALDPKVKIEPPDLAKIKTAVNDEKSPYYYPTLLSKFMSNDTVMGNEDFRHFYYGALFQEDYDPYRKPLDEERLAQIQPLYYQTEHTDAEKKAMLSYAEDALKDNPLDLVQLKNKIYVLEKQQKVNLAKIWKNKLNHLLFVIASSGSGQSQDSPWVVVYPRHEFDVFNIYGRTVVKQEYELPHHDHLQVDKKGEETPEDYYFDLGPILEQYYMKHPSEYLDEAPQDN